MILSPRKQAHLQFLSVTILNSPHKKRKQATTDRTCQTWTFKITTGSELGGGEGNINMYLKIHASDTCHLYSNELKNTDTFIY